MIIFKKEWLNNLQLIKQAEKDFRSDCITADELKLIRLEYPVGFYRPGIFAAIGLFVLTVFIISAASGLLSLFIAQLGAFNAFVWTAILGALIYALLEFIMREYALFHSGIDNAAIYISGGLIVGGLIWVGSPNAGYLTNAVVIFLISVYLTLRFADVLTASIACLSIFAIVFFSWQKVGTFGLATMPFMIMFAAGAAYTFITKLGRRHVAIYYENCLLIIRIACLLTFYAAGNYLVVNRLNNQLNNLDNATHTAIPFGIIFWIWTFALPVAYLYIGIAKKQSMLLRLGLLLVVAAILTFRTYYHLFPIEIMLTLGGAFLLCLSFGVIRYFKQPRYGITYKESDDKTLWDNLKIESLITGEMHSHNPTMPVDNDYHFGGGSAGGGGSSADF